MVRTFEPSAHLRSRAAALHPVPLARKVAQALAAASTVLFEEDFHSSRSY
jgi:hypothetical protein